MAAKTILGLDTSTLSLSLAVVRQEADGSWRTLARRQRGPGGPNHSVLLPTWVGEVLAQAGVRLDELDGIAVGLGPGGFTGLRIALATGKGLAYAAHVPLAGASSLEAMALAAAGLAPEATAIVPLLDARKGEVYAGFYRPGRGAGAAGILPLSEGPAEVVAPPEAVAERLAGLEGPLVLLGQGYFAYRTLFDEATEGARIDGVEGLPEVPPAAEVAVLATRTLGPYSKEQVFALEPHYIRPWDAEPGRTTPKRRV